MTDTIASSNTVLCAPFHRASSVALCTAVSDTSTAFHRKFLTSFFPAFRVNLLSPVRYAKPAPDSVFCATIGMSTELLRARNSCATVRNTQTLGNCEFLAAFNSTRSMRLGSSVSDAKSSFDGVLTATIGVITSLPIPTTMLAAPTVLDRFGGAPFRITYQAHVRQDLRLHLLGSDLLLLMRSSSFHIP